MLSAKELMKAAIQFASRGRFSFGETNNQTFTNIHNRDYMDSVNAEDSKDVTERRRYMVLGMGFRNVGSDNYEIDKNPFNLLQAYVQHIEKNPVIERGGKTHSRLSPLHLHDVAEDLRKSDFKGKTHDLLDEKYSPEELADILDKCIQKYHGRFNDIREISSRAITKNLEIMKEEHKVLIHKTKLEKWRHYRAEVITNYLTQKFSKARRESEEQRIIHELKIKVDTMCSDMSNALTIKDISAELPPKMKSEWMSYMWGSEN